MHTKADRGILIPATTGSMPVLAPCMWPPYYSFLWERCLLRVIIWDNNVQYFLCGYLGIVLDHSPMVMGVVGGKPYAANMAW